MRAIQFLSAGAASVVILLLAAASINAYPKPAPAPKSWEMTFTHGDPQPIAVKQSDGRTQWYWYMTYKIVNDTDREQQWIPEITVTTDQGAVMIAGENVPAAVFNQIKQREANELLEHPDRIVGKILLGEDNARESVAIWPAQSEDADQWTIFVSGVSGETAVIADPDDAAKQVVLRKNYWVEYATPGDNEVHPQDQSIKRIGAGWVMR